MIPPSPRIGIYARYSSDLQNPSSIDDQIALCRQLIADQMPGADPAKALVFSDAAASGSSMERPGILGLLAAARAGRVTLVVAEGLDRLSRSLKDIATIHEALGYHGATIHTAHEGRVTELHVGLKGTMNALFLRDMKARIRRGQAARATAGFAPTGRTYGYRVVRGVVDDKGRTVNGVREIDEAEAEIVRRIFQEVARGRKIMEVITGLNDDGIPAPAGGIWKLATVAGTARRGTGILRNEIYIGTIVYNRTRTVRDPATGKRGNPLNPEDQWTRAQAPHLRIIDDDLWERVQDRLRRSRSEGSSAPKPPRILSTHNQHALTGWVKCGQCGGPKSIANKGRYICSNNRYTSSCRNSRGVKEPVLMAAVFETLYGRLKAGRDFREAFLDAFAREIRESEESQRRLADIDSAIARLVDAVERGVEQDHTVGRILALQEEKRRLLLDIEQEAPPPLPDEAAIRAALARAVAAVEMSRDVKRTRLMFQCLLEKVVLTPIPGRPRGETFEVTLREEGWPEFWRNGI